MNMASARRKQDEKNLKTIRELVSLPLNKHCFECNQRGPTYVNVTIGSFICTKCSGMLRGLTPPHRVKSISMATFTQEEIELLKTRGNDYCQQVWLGLFDGTKPSSDESAMHTFMLDKYERKRYYMEPSIALRNSYNQEQNEVAIIKQCKQDVQPLTSIIAEPRPLKVNNVNGNVVNGFDNGSNFVADFAHADIFNASYKTSNKTNNNNNNSSTTTTTATTNFNQQQQQTSFANFDNNPIFCNEPPTEGIKEFSIFDLQFTNCGPVYNQVPLFRKMNLNRWSFQPSTPPNQTNYFNGMNGNCNGFSSTNHQPTNPSIITNAAAQTPKEDRYAALKDLDNALKSQAQLEWSSAGSNSSLYSSPATPGSFYSSTASPQSSSYGSPSQGQFLNLYPSTNETASSHVSNPFNLNGSAGLLCASTFNGNGNQNPFRASPENLSMFSSHNCGGIGDIHSSSFATPINGTAWTPNPFKIASGNSSNPFL